MPDTAELQISFLEGLTLAHLDDSKRQLKGGRIDLAFSACSAGVLAVLDRLAGPGGTDDELFALTESIDGESAFHSYVSLMVQLSSAGALRYSAYEGKQRLAEFRWLAPGGTLDEFRAEPGCSYTLSRFAYLRKDGAQMVLECPLGRAQIRLLDQRAIAAVGLWAQPATADTIARRVGLSINATLILMNLLCNADAVLATERSDTLVGGTSGSESEPPTGWWSFHDLLFHSRCRLGRHDNPYGGTFVHQGKAPPPAMVKEEAQESVVPLYKPDMEALKLQDDSFTSVLESRRSRRHYADRPITLQQLGEFLYRSARVQKVIPTGPNDMDYSYRPSPGGGAIHELEIYPVIGQCEGLESGIFHYNPLHHHLTRVADRTPEVEQFLEMAWITADRKSKPNICFAITARFTRFQWKYESMVYAAILKNVGALYQTLYLVATAMGLAPCALGGGDSDLFARAAGLDYYSEGTVGEFMLGSRGD